MPFICEGNSYFGLVEAGGKRYTFVLKMSETSETGRGGKGTLTIDNKLYRELGDELEKFINDFRNFVTPEHFYKQLSEFIKKNVKLPEKTKTWYRHASKISAITKSLAQEIHLFEEYMTYFDFETQIVKFEVPDSQLRIHKAVIKFSLNYKFEPLCIISHDLPLQNIEGQNSIGLNNTFTIADFFEKFLELINYFQNFWNEISLIDSQCCVLDPAKPTFKDTYRRIKLNDTVSVALMLNPFNVAQRPTIKLLGRQLDVNHYQDILQKNLENDLWEDEKDLLYNLSNILEVSLPSKIFTEEPESLDLIETGECAICFTWRLDDNIPNEICENPNCKSIYHSICLFTYFSSVPRNRDYFGKMQGECPNCDEIMSCTLPKFL